MWNVEINPGEAERSSGIGLKLFGFAAAFGRMIGSLDGCLARPVQGTMVTPWPVAPPRLLLKFTALIEAMVVWNE